MKESANLYGALLHWFTESQLEHIGSADPELCFVLDVFQRKTFRGPKSFKQRRDQLAFSCKEISDRWNAGPYSAGTASASK